MQGWRSALQRGTREWRPSDDRPDIFYFLGPPRRKEFLLESWPADHSCTRAAALTPREEGAADKLLRPGCSGRLFAAADECRCRIARAAPSPAAAPAGLESPRRKGRRGRQRRKATGNNTAKTGSVGGAFSGCARRWISGGRKAERVESATPLRCVCLGSFFSRGSAGAPRRHSLRFTAVWGHHDGGCGGTECRGGMARWQRVRRTLSRWAGVGALTGQVERRWAGSLRRIYAATPNFPGRARDGAAADDLELGRRTGAAWSLSTENLCLANSGPAVSPSASC